MIEPIKVKFALSADTQRKLKNQTTVNQTPVVIQSKDLSPGKLESLMANIFQDDRSVGIYNISSGNNDARVCAIPKDSALARKIQTLNATFNNLHAQRVYSSDEKVRDAESAMQTAILRNNLSKNQVIEVQLATNDYAG